MSLTDGWRRRRAMDTLSARGNSVSERARAFEALRGLPLTDDSLALLTRLATGGDYYYSGEAIRTLAGQTDPRALRVVIRLFEQGNDEAYSGLRWGRLPPAVEDEVIAAARRVALANLGWQYRRERCQDLLREMKSPSARAAADEIERAYQQHRRDSVPALLRTALTSTSFNDIEEAVKELRAIDTPAARTALDEFIRTPSRKVTYHYEVVVAENFDEGTEQRESRFQDRFTSYLGQPPGADEQAAIAAAAAARDAEERAKLRARADADPFAYGDGADIKAALAWLVKDPSRSPRVVRQLFDAILAADPLRLGMLAHALRAVDAGALAVRARAELAERGPEKTARLLETLSPGAASSLDRAYVDDLRTRVAGSWAAKRETPLSAALMQADRGAFWSVLETALRSASGPWPPLIPLLSAFGSAGVTLAASLLEADDWHARRALVRLLAASPDPQARAALTGRLDREADCELQQEIRAVLAKGSGGSTTG